MVVLEFDGLAGMEQEVLMMDKRWFPMVLNDHLSDDNLSNNVYSMRYSVYLNVRNDYDYSLYSYSNTNNDRMRKYLFDLRSNDLNGMFYYVLEKV